LHKEEFNEPEEFNRIEKQLEGRGVPEITSSENLALFDLTKWPSE